MYNTYKENFGFIGKIKLSWKYSKKKNKICGKLPMFGILKQRGKLYTI